MANHTTTILLACIFLTQGPKFQGAEPKQQEIDQLISELGNDEPEKRQAALQKLVSIGVKALPALANAINNKDLEVKLRATEAIKTITPVELKKLEQIHSHIMYLGMSKAAVESKLLDGYKKVLEKLAQIGSPSNILKNLVKIHHVLELNEKKTLLTYIQRFYSTSSTFRHVALKWPEDWKFDMSEIIEPTKTIVKDLLGSTDPGALHTSIQAVKDFNLKEMISFVRKHIQNEKLDRRIVLATVIFMGDNEAVPEIIKLLSHSDWSIRSYGAEALGDLKAKEAIDSLLGLLDDKGYETNYIDKAILALGKIGNSKVIPHIRKFLNHKESRDYMRQVAILALIQLNDKEVRTDICAVNHFWNNF